MLRRLLLLAVLLVSAPAFAQAPPVPPVADADRYQSFAITSSTPSVDLNFPVYGDGSDIVVKRNGVPQAGGAYSFSSASGRPIGSIPRPITDGRITFTTPPTSGTIEVIGAYRPRMTTMQTSAGISRREFNQGMGQIVSTQREMFRALNQVSTGGTVGIAGTTAYGAAPPASPYPFQIWIDTSTSPYIERMWDGSQWMAVAQIDSSAHHWAVVGTGVSIQSYGANCAATAAANQTAIQNAFNLNPKAEIIFDGGCNYNAVSEIILTDETHSFGGTVRFVGSTSVTFTDTSGAANTDATMIVGFRMYKKDPANEQSGGINIKFYRPVVNGPLHGAGIYFANSQGVSIHDPVMSDDRYGIVGENSIGITVVQGQFNRFKNAGVGILSTGNPNTFQIAGSYFNDTWNVSNNVMAGTSGSIACILDHGSGSFPTRIIDNNACEGGWNGTNFVGTQYHYITRTGVPRLHHNWAEAVPYPIRFLASTDTGNLPGVSGAEPSGTYAISNFPGGYSYGATLENNETNEANIAFNVSGVNGPVVMTNNRSQTMVGPNKVMIFSEQSGNNFIVDTGNVLLGAGTRFYSLYQQFLTTGASGFYPNVMVAPAAMTLASCGTGATITPRSSNNAGQFQVGTGATSCVVNFGTPYKNIAYCVVTPATNAASPFVSTNTQTGFAIGNATAGAVYNYACGGN